MNTRLLLVGALALATPFAAHAQGAPGLNGTVTLGYSSSSIDPVNTDLDTVSIGFASDIVFSPNFSLGFDLDLARVSVDGAPLDLDLTRISLEPTYTFGNGAYVGLYYQMNDLDISTGFIPIGLSLQIDSYGVFGGYESGPWGVELYYGQSDTEPTLPAGIDITDYGLTGFYDVSPDLSVYGRFARTELETPGPDLEIDLISLGADYTFQNGLMLFGSAGRLDVGGLPVSLDGTQLALGIGYDLANLGGGFPAMVSLELSRTDLDLGGASADIDTISLGLSFPIGQGASDVPLNSSNRITRGDIRSALIAGVSAGL